MRSIVNQQKHRHYLEHGPYVKSEQSARPAENAVHPRMIRVDCLSP